MTEGAFRRPFVELGLLEVAEETGGGGDCNVLPLHDLGVATGTSQPFLPAEFGQVGAMVKEDTAVNLLPQEKPFFVATGAQATGVGDLGPRPGEPPSGEVRGDHPGGFQFLL